MTDFMIAGVILILVFFAGMMILIYNRSNTSTTFNNGIIGHTPIVLPTVVIPANSSVQQSLVIPVGWVVRRVRFATSGVTGDGQLVCDAGTTSGGTDIVNQQQIYQNAWSPYNSAGSVNFGNSVETAAMDNDITIYITLTSTYTQPMHISSDYQLVTICDFAEC